jgi:hypothetical protein
VEFLVSISFLYEFDSRASSKWLAYEVYRAMGSLIYQNGSKLNESNLNRLLVIQNKGDSPLLVKIRVQLELELQEIIKSNSYSSAADENLELLKKLDLMSTQLIYNLTIPSVATPLNSPFVSTSVNSSAEAPSFAYIDEKHKAKCSNLLMKILRFHHMNKEFAGSAETNLILSSEDYKVNKSKILSKALQALESLFNSIKTSNLQQVELNWLKIDTAEQIGDILAIIKVNLKFKFLFQKTFNLVSSKTF